MAVPAVLLVKSIKNSPNGIYLPSVLASWRCCLKSWTNIAIVSMYRRVFLLMCWTIWRLRKFTLSNTLHNKLMLVKACHKCFKFHFPFKCEPRLHLEADQTAHGGCYSGCHIPHHVIYRLGSGTMGERSLWIHSSQIWYALNDIPFCMRFFKSSSKCSIQ